MPGMFTAVSLPINSTCGGRPGEKIRSEILSDTESINCTTCEKLIVDMGEIPHAVNCITIMRIRPIMGIVRTYSSDEWKRIGATRGRLAILTSNQPMHTQG